jgi:hypothetical protein
LLPQAVRAFSDVLLGRLGQFSSPLVKHGPTLGGMGALEAGPCRPAIGGDSGPPIQASIVCESSNAGSQRRGAGPSLSPSLARQMSGVV